METKIITDEDEFLALREDWERLMEQDQDATYYSTFEFNYYWWQTFGNDKNKKLFILCHYRDNVLVAIAPLMIRCIDKKIVKSNVLCFLGKGDYFNFIIDSSKFKASSIIREIFNTIEENSAKWDKIELTHLQMDTQLLRYLMRNDHYSKYTEYLTSCSRINSDDYTSYAQFEQEMVNTKLRRKRVKLQNETGYRFRVVSGSQSEDIYEKIAYIHQLEKQYLQEVKGRTDRGSLFEDSNNEQFLKRLFKGNDRVMFFYLESDDGEIIMYKCCYLYQNVLYGWNTGYSPKYSHFHGISDVLLMEMIEHVFKSSNIKQIDFGAGSYSWKFRWTNQFSVSYSLMMWNESSQQFKLLQFLNQSREILRAIKELKKAL
ncbi:GNAT family N-acetyltransferase [Paenibacillus sp. KQZ6P-2]|uniref:GNAT family N-acetyltransferase n=1 Tax=Paenibacillus mangrovi TaxID=2931978 RepID=A0A9X1WK52_9BACL|nr:GNAT family N-acetyltransferase [Paenibacillus mangrovi]MCJ8010478.1 GNAT family N-acetyltransferase [Paenibacillus mangrovi]